MLHQSVLLMEDLTCSHPALSICVLGVNSAMIQRLEMSCIRSTRRTRCVCVFKAPRTRSPGPHECVGATPRGYMVPAWYRFDPIAGTPEQLRVCNYIAFL